MKEILKMVLGKDKVSGHKITIDMKVISRIICLMDKEFMNIQMGENTKDLGHKESWMGTESFTSTMTESTQGIIWMINEKEKEEWSGLLKRKYTKDNGKMENKKGLELRKWKEKSQKEGFSKMGLWKPLSLQKTLNSNISISMKLKILRRLCLFHQPQPWSLYLAVLFVL